jgi:glycosyltransferase involved in cell wall biosynthesis
MKIGFLIESMAVASGGPSRVAGVIASGLAERGHEVRIGTLPRDSELVKVNPQVIIEHVSGKVSNPLNWMSAVAGIRRLASQVDVLFVSGIWGPVDGLCLRLANVRNIPVHIRICGMLEDYILKRNPGRKWIGRNFYTDRNLMRAASLIVNTKIEKRHVEELGFTNPIRVIPNGVVLPTADDKISREQAARLLGLELRKSDKVLLYLSRIHPKKGLHVLLEAIVGDFRDRGDWRLVVAGDFFQGEGYEERIRHAVASSGMSDRIHFVGEVAGERKRAAFSLADLFVLPSESEGFSNAIIEAMSWGLPALITEGCNFPEVGEEKAGWVTEPKSGAVKRALLEAIADDDRRIAMGGSARSLVERCYQQSHVIDLYESLAASSVHR